MTWLWSIFCIIQNEIEVTLERMFPIRHKPLVLKTPDGICEDCGGIAIRLDESGVMLCKGCGYVWPISLSAYQVSVVESKIQTKEKL